MKRGEMWIGAGAVVVIMTILSGCEEDAGAPAGQDRPALAASGASALPSHARVRPAPSAADDAGASRGEAEAGRGEAEAEGGAPSTAGTWEGSYEAKKGAVALPPKVKDTVRAKDDGKAAIGPGSVTLRIEPDGELRGTAKGALGDATIVGKVDGDRIRASVYPDDPHAEHAMTGILVGMLKDGVIRAELRVSGPDAVLIRESDVELRPR